MLGSIKTCDLLEEVIKREGVDEIIVKPYAEYKVAVDGKIIEGTGPAIILVVTD